MAQQGMDLNNTCKLQIKLDDLRNEARESSRNNVHLRKIIESVIEKEKMTVSDDELNTEIASWNDEKIKTLDDYKSSKDNKVETLKNNLLNKRLENS